MLATAAAVALLSFDVAPGLVDTAASASHGMGPAVAALAGLVRRSPARNWAYIRCEYDDETSIWITHCVR